MEVRMAIGSFVNRGFLQLFQKVLAMPYYAVGRGRNAGIYESWSECESQVKGYSGARYKKFNSEHEARSFVQEHSGGSSYASGGPTCSSGGLSHFFGSCSESSGHSGCPQNVRRKSSTNPVRLYSTKNNASKTSSKSSLKIVATDKSSVGSEINESYSIDDLDDPIEINEAVCKQLDALEKLDALENRLEGITKDVDKVYNKFGKRSKRTLSTEPHHLSKRSCTTRRGSKEFDVSNYVQVYTDGACSSNGQRGARAGYGVYWGPDHPYNESGPVDRPTNNSGEIRAAVRACEQAKEQGLGKICINTDSKFLIDSTTKWMHGWKKNGWTLKSGEPVKNKEDFQHLDQAMRGIDVKFRHVEAHKGIHGNECADELARRGAASGRKY